MGYITIFLLFIIVIFGNAHTACAFADRNCDIEDKIQFEKVDKIPNKILGFDSFSINQEETVYSSIFTKEDMVYIVYCHDGSEIIYKLRNLNQRKVYNMLQDDGSLFIYLLDDKYLIKINDNVSFASIDSSKEGEIIGDYIYETSPEVTLLDNGVSYVLTKGTFTDRLVRIEYGEKEILYCKLTEYAIHLVFMILLFLIYVGCVIYSKINRLYPSKNRQSICPQTQHKTE